jgi:hypothetical protein
MFVVWIDGVIGCQQLRDTLSTATIRHQRNWDFGVFMGFGRERGEELSFATDL